MGFFTNSLQGTYSWNSNSEQIGEKIKVFSIHGNGEYLLIPKEFYKKKPSDFFVEKEYLLNGLLWSKKWPKEVLIDSDEDLRNELSKFNIPLSPQEKLDNLFEYLFNNQKEDGVLFKISLSFNSNLSNSLFFKSNREFTFYINTLNDKGLIYVKNKLGSDARALGGSHIPEGFELNITFNGFEYYNRLTNEGLKSKNCFIAMSFSPQMTLVRDALKSSCKQTGFIPILIDEVHADADKTINDEIIASIKKSKFCISDFTEQKDGVYFEAGFALGRGLKVIYTCQRTDFKDSHFDTNHFPHIIYDTVEELEEKLINKIEAWIKD